MNTAGGKGFFFGLGGFISPGDDGSSVSHPASFWCGGACDESSDGFGAVIFGPLGGFDFSGSSDFSDHDDGFRFGVVLEHFQCVEVGGSIDRVSSDADAGALAEPQLGGLPDGFVGEGA